MRGFRLVQFFLCVLYADHVATSIAVRDVNARLVLGDLYIFGSHFG
jgi:hypothetical protein